MDENQGKPSGRGRSPGRGGGHGRGGGGDGRGGGGHQPKSPGRGGRGRGGSGEGGRGGGGHAPHSPGRGRGRGAGGQTPPHSPNQGVGSPKGRGGRGGSHQSPGRGGGGHPQGQSSPGQGPAQHHQHQHKDHKHKHKHSNDHGHSHHEEGHNGHAAAHSAATPTLKKNKPNAPTQPAGTTSFRVQSQDGRSISIAVPSSRTSVAVVAYLIGLQFPDIAQIEGEMYFTDEEGDKFRLTDATLETLLSSRSPTLLIGRDTIQQDEVESTPTKDKGKGNYKGPEKKTMPLKVFDASTLKPFKTEREIQGYLISLGKKKEERGETLAVEILRTRHVFKLLLDFEFATPTLIQQVVELLVMNFKDVFDHQREILALVAESKFIRQTLGLFIRTGMHTEEAAVLVIQLCHIVLQEAPGQAGLLPLSDLRVNVKDRFGDNADLDQRAKNLVDLRDAYESTRVKAAAAAVARPPPADRRDRLRIRTVLTSPFAYESDIISALDNIPRIDELIKGRDEELRGNVVDAAWPDGRSYLATHYRLLREDFLSPLRSGIWKYMEEGKAHGDVVVYRCRLQAGDFQDGMKRDLVVYCKLVNQKIDWKFSDKLKGGSLVFLVPVTAQNQPDFQNPIFATIGGDPKKRETKDLIGLNLRDLKQIPCLDWATEYVMFESSAYFLSVEPALNSLKKLDPNELPFHRTILNGEDATLVPNYIKAHPNGLDMSNVYSNFAQSLGRSRIRAHGTRLPRDGEPPASSLPALRTTLDDSQLNALYTVLNHRVALIQGPPGAGKTFIGVKAVRLLLQMVTRPILVVCYTNHALDQFLEYLLEFTQPGELLRVGGRSKSENEKLLACNMIRKTEPTRSERKDFAQARERRDRLLAELGDISRGIAGNKPTKEIISAVFGRCYDQFSKIPGFPEWKVEGDKRVPWKVSEGYELWMGFKEKARADDLRKAAQKAEDERKKPVKNSFAALGDEETVENDEADDAADELRKMETDRLLAKHQPQMLNRQPQAAAAAAAAAPAPAQASRSLFDRLRDAYNLSGQPATSPSSPAPYPEYSVDDEDELDYDDEDFGQNWMDASIVEAEARPVIHADRQLLIAEAIQSLSEADKAILNWLTQPNFNVWDLSKANRKKMAGVVERVWRGVFKAELGELMGQFRALAKTFKGLDDASSLRAMQSAKIIGMTSTGCAMNQHIIKLLNPQVVIVEEAGELLEAQLVACVPKTCEHLVLIGDHQQLRPKINDYELELHANFHISLFERLIKLKVPSVQLTHQSRMRPEIADLVRPFYQNLQDSDRIHPETIKGVGSNLFWIDHNEYEAGNVGSRKEKRNDWEVEYTAKLADYFLKQGYSRDDVTIITPYSGQKFAIKKRLMQLGLNGPTVCPRVVTIDDYQGEESNIIIISMVRNNTANNLGFTKIDNRIIVALSRAKHGMYILGASQFFANNNKHWERIVGQLQARKAVGQLELFCQNHKETSLVINTHEDFSCVRNGGCTKPCEFLLPCGHKCPQLCHPVDREHKHVVCNRPCDRTLSCGHKCKSICAKDCPACKELVTRQLPCGHSLQAKCFEEVTTLVCKEACAKTHRTCGHKCAAKCGQKCPPCGFTVDKFALNCTIHPIKMACAKAPPAVCEQSCTFRHPCGHSCPGTCLTCKEGHPKCVVVCCKELICGHKCQQSCGVPCACTEPCSNYCTHGRCSKVCGEPCVQCLEPCPWQCPHHRCSKKCHEECDRQVCDKQCKKKLKCDHRCQGVCGEDCPPCPRCEGAEIEDPISLDTMKEMFEDDKRTLFIRLPDCKHVFSLKNLDEHVFRNDVQMKDGHASVELKQCPTCRTKIRSVLRYNSVVKSRMKTLELIKKKIWDIYLKYLALEAERKRALTLEERAKVMEALAGELGGAHAGHWFTCPNGHPYAIGECGGAMQVSKCPDCGAAVGGNNHALLGDNRRYDNGPAQPPPQ